MLKNDHLSARKPVIERMRGSIRLCVCNCGMLLLLMLGIARAAADDAITKVALGGKEYTTKVVLDRVRTAMPRAEKVKIEWQALWTRKFSAYSDE